MLIDVPTTAVDDRIYHTIIAAHIFVKQKILPMSITKVLTTRVCRTNNFRFFFLFSFFTTQFVLLKTRVRKMMIYQ